MFRYIQIPPVGIGINFPGDPIHIYWKKKKKIMNQGVNCVLHVAINPQNAWQNVLRSILSITSRYIALYHWLHHKVTTREGGVCNIFSFREGVYLRIAHCRSKASARVFIFDKTQLQNYRQIELQWFNFLIIITS